MVIEGGCSVIRVLQNWQCVWSRANHLVGVRWGRMGWNKKEQSGKQGLREHGWENERGRPPGPSLLSFRQRFAVFCAGPENVE